eukprot:CAMPEP_0202882200 /NCGR_PEP_ID=MMETSP1391-20130828/37671_1 /ASSEMBLY_ACC=CAM_ASM_000867 /TAXON_ID=1034604 /ORGANISM="Chlamydomonas leiostraca, Strain SAG 11-49" /LENGTH=124 /DNA_ID=CAMNT_0049565019 /DNA_START=443 /DNA_END=818 /DNA_ORIENTATION=-
MTAPCKLPLAAASALTRHPQRFCQHTQVAASPAAVLPPELHLPPLAALCSLASSGCAALTWPLMLQRPAAQLRAAELVRRVDVANDGHHHHGQGRVAARDAPLIDLVRTWQRFLGHHNGLHERV